MLMLAENYVPHLLTQQVYWLALFFKQFKIYSEEKRLVPRALIYTSLDSTEHLLHFFLFPFSSYFQTNLILFPSCILYPLNMNTFFNGQSPQVPLFCFFFKGDYWGAWVA